MSDCERVRVQLGERARRFEDCVAVLRPHRGERKGLEEEVRDGRTPKRREGVTREEEPITGVEERHMPRCMARRRDHLQAADPLPTSEAYIRLRLQRRPGTSALAGDDRFACKNTNVLVAKIDRHRISERVLECVDAACVIAVAVRQSNPDDRRAGFFSCVDERLRASTEPGVDQCEAVVFSDEIGIDEAGFGQLKNI